MGGSVADKIDYTGAPALNPKTDLGGKYNIDASPDAFGASMFTAMHNLGEKGFDAVIKRQELVNDLDHNQRAVAASKDLTKAWSDYGQLEGDAAVKGYPAFQDRLQSIYQQHLDDPTVNPAVKKQLAGTMFRDVDRWMGHGASYADTQLRSWHNKVHDDALETNRSETILNRNGSPKDLEGGIEHGWNGVGGLDSVRERVLHKLDPDADLNDPKVKAVIEGEVSKERSKAVLLTVKELADENNVKHAKEVYDHFKDKLSAEGRVAVEGFLQPKIRTMRIAEIADREKPIPDEAGSFPTVAAEQHRLTVGANRPSPENLAALGGQNKEWAATGGSHPSDHFIKLERGGAGLDYINKADTGGSHSYGSLGLNSRGGETSSASQFAKANPHLGLEGAPGSMQFDRSWQVAAHEQAPELRAAEQKWWSDHYLAPVPEKLKGAGVAPAIANDRLVQLYMADRNDQYGEHILDARSGNPKQVTHIERMQEAAKQANGDPKKFLDIVRAQDVAHLQGDFGSTPHSALNTGAYSATSHQERLNGRMAAAQQALAAENGTPAPTAGTQPGASDSVISPGYTARAASRQSNLIKAHVLAGGDIALEHGLRAEFDRRDVLMKTNLTGQRQVIQDTVKNLDLMASKGLPDSTLEHAGLSEPYIRSLWADKPHIAEHIIENNRLQSKVANTLSSMKYAPKEEWDKLLVDTNQGLGIDSMIQQHRKGAATTSAFEMGADPEANAEVMTNNFALREKLATTVRKAHTDRFLELNKDPAAFLVSSKNPAIIKAAQAVHDSKTPGEVQAAFRNYASLQIATQRSMGVPEDKLRVMSVGKAEEQANFIMKSQDAKGELEKMKAIYGDLYPAVFKDTVALGKLPSKFEALGDLDNQNAGLLAGRIKAEASVKGAEHQREMRTLLDSDLKTITTTVHGDVTMKQYLHSMASRGVSDPLRTEVSNTVNMLAQARVMELKEDPKTAAAEAVKAFTKNYTFTKDDVAIPADKHDAVMAEAHDKLSWVSEDDIQVPKAVQDINYTAKDYANNVKATSVWKATPDGDGMYLVDHWGHPVLTKDGKTVNIRYDRPQRSISAKSELSTSPNLFFESLGD
jgi:hypothetical protein